MKTAIVLAVFYLSLFGMSVQFATAQNYLLQSFDSVAFPPAGWENVYVSGDTTSVGSIIWYRQVSYGSSFPSISTHSGSGMAYYNSWAINAGGEALLTTPPIDFTAYTAGSNRVAFWFYRSADVISGWNGYETDTMNIWVNKSASLSGAVKLKTLIDGIRSAPIVTTAGWYKYAVDIPDSFSTSSHVYIIFDAVSAYNDNMFLDDVSVDHVPPCSGTPTVSLLPGTVNLVRCIGGPFSLNGTSGSMNAGQVYQWQFAASYSGPWTNIVGASDTFYNGTALAGTTYYRLKDSCGATGNIGYSLVDTVSTSLPVFASLPYVQDFENWQNYCNLLDVPGGSWSNTYSSGDSSWRRDDQGCNYGEWTSCIYTVNNLGGNTYESGAHCARFHSSGGLLAGSPPKQGALNLYINCSGAGDKLLQFYFKNQNSSSIPYSHDSLYVLMSIDAGVTFTRLWSGDTAQEWKKVQVQLPSTSTTTIIKFLAKRLAGGYPGTFDVSDIGLDSVYVGNPCTALTSGGFLDPSGTISSCPGVNYYLEVNDIPLKGGIQYQWQMATAPFSTFNDIIGATSFNYNSTILFDTVQYRVKVTCTYSTPSATKISAVTTIQISPVAYAKLSPSVISAAYHYSFENWNDRCASSDAPVVAAGSNISNWANYPTTGENSWRRDDEGSTAGWGYSFTYYPYEYSPVAYDSSHSARRSTFYHDNSPQQPSNLYLFIDCSSVIGNKELQYYINLGVVDTTYISDTLATLLSTDGGSTFSLLRKDYNGNGAWQLANVTLRSNSPTTIICFQGTYGSPIQSHSTGLGLDEVKILNACTGKPIAGTLKDDTVCANQLFIPQLISTSQSGNLAYQWQQSDDNIIWANVIGDTTLMANFHFTKEKYIRVVVKCNNSGLSDTSNGALISITPFYKCYCNPATTVQSVNILGAFGRVTILKQSGDTILDHITGGTNALLNSWPWDLTYGDQKALNGNTDFRDTMLPATLYIDSSYKFLITEVSYSSSFSAGYPINAYIDYNHNSVFEDSLPKELIFNKTVSSAYSPTAEDTMHVPPNALTGLTGMRLIMGIYHSSPLNPCGFGPNAYGEIRDYLVNIDYAPCTGPLYAGIAASSDSALCAGYSFMLTDTTHDYHHNSINWSWQQSIDGKTWKDIAGTTKRDTLTQTLSATTWYRMQMICVATHDTTFSNSVKMRAIAPYNCYCNSMSTGGSAKDSSDIGVFTFGSFTVNKKGGHTLNTAATHSHTSYTNKVLDLYVDPTYPLILSHILKTAKADSAKITLFIDYNNNFQYDIPTELVWKAYTSVTNWILTTVIKIPESVVSDVLTGMRVVLNNNTAANPASDDGCGAYTSGETMDFVVRFNRAWTTGVGTINGLENLSVYPNPSNGKFTVQFSATNTVKNLQISISNMTGQQVFEHAYGNTSGQFNTEIDLGNVARGVYFVSFVADGERMIRKMVLK